MKEVNVRFERDRKQKDIYVVVRADRKDKQVNTLMEKISIQEPEKLTVLDSDNCSCVIEEAEIIFVSSDGKSVRVTAASGIFRAKLSLQSMEEKLSRKFLRISRFELINLSKVKKYDFTMGGTLRIEFENGMETWASRRYIPIIRERLTGEEGYLC